MAAVRDWAEDNRSALTVAAVGTGLGAALWLYRRSSKSRYHKTPSSFELSGGAVDASKVKDTVRRLAGEALGTLETEKTPVCSCLC